MEEEEEEGECASSLTCLLLFLSLSFFLSLSLRHSGPIVAMTLARENAIAAWRELIGPTNSEKARETAPTRFLFSLSFF